MILLCGDDKTHWVLVVIDNIKYHVTCYDYFQTNTGSKSIIREYIMLIVKRFGMMNQEIKGDQKKIYIVDLKI